MKFISSLRDRPYCIILLFFLFSRIVYAYVFNTRFVTAALNGFWQLLDPVLLKNDLLRSLYFSHFEPPLYNLFLGIVLKLFDSYQLAFHICYLVMGFAFSCSLFNLMKMLKVRYGIALTLVLFHTVSPVTVLYENWLFYPYPLALLMCASAIFLGRFVLNNKLIDGMNFFFTLTALALIHGKFNLPWYIICLIGVVCFSRISCKQIVKAALIPTLILVTVCMKQYIVFGTWQPGKIFLATNLAGRIGYGLADDQKMKLFDANLVPAFFFEPTFKPFSHYKPFLPPIPSTGIPALDEDTKSTGVPNFNYLGYFYQADAYMEGIKNIIRVYPKSLLNLFVGWKVYFHPASDDVFVRNSNYADFALMRKLVDGYELIICGKWLPGHAPGYWLMIGFPVLLLYGVYQFLYYLPGSGTRQIKAILSAYMVFMILYDGVVSFVSWNDYNRYRFEVDAFYLTLLAMLVSHLCDIWTARQNRLNASV